ncbi:MAG: hypothetical protein ACO201_03795 [Rickettsiales bacterium]
MEKKFNMMLYFYDFFTRFHLFFEIDSGLKDSGKLSEHESDIYRKNILEILSQHILQIYKFHMDFTESKDE